MSRNDFILAFILGLILLSGVMVESIRGANKTAKVFITHPIESPFNSDPSQQVQQNTSIQNNQTSSGTISVHLNNSETKIINFLNNASNQELMQISGIGEAYAQRIIDARNKKAFVTARDVLNVNGIGQAKWNSMLEFIESKPSIPSNQTFLPPTRVPIINRPILEPYQSPSTNPKMNLNLAKKEDFIKISGIGDVTANNLLKTRHARGQFKNWEQVKEVSGIGDKRLAELQENFFIQ